MRTQAFHLFEQFIPFDRTGGLADPATTNQKDQTERSLNGAHRIGS